MNSKTKRLVMTALFIALGTIVPQAFHMLGLGPSQVFLPMHLPVMICGSLLGPIAGLICGLITPLLSSVLTGMPPLMPVGLAMAVEQYLDCFNCFYAGGKISKWHCQCVNSWIQCFCVWYYSLSDNRICDGIAGFGDSADTGTALL